MAKFKIVNNHSSVPGTTAVVTILGTVPQVDEHGDPLPPLPPFSVLVVTHDGRFLELHAPQPLALNLALKIHASDAIWLGTVESCALIEISSGEEGRAAEEGRSGQSWHVVIQVSRVLRDLETIRRLADLFGSSPAANPNLFRGMAVQA